MRGICALTHEEGEFLASHLIPKALTRPSKRGQPLVQYASGRKPLRRWDSWYDDRLVTVKGEALLTDLDTWAIRHMRAHRLVWSGWGNSDSLAGYFTPMEGTSWGIPRISGLDTGRMRLLFLSLLWRAAATSRPEFAEVTLAPEDVEQLRSMILTGRCEPADFYRIQLTQLSTRGAVQNMAPIGQYKDVRTHLPGLPHRLEKILRFYFDGLIVHYHTPDGNRARDAYGPLVLGASRDLIVSTVTYEASFQRENLETVLAESLHSADAFD